MTNFPDTWLLGNFDLAFVNSVEYSFAKLHLSSGITASWLKINGTGSIRGALQDPRRSYPIEENNLCEGFVEAAKRERKFANVSIINVAEHPLLPSARIG
jgi:hypothetical protein